MSPELGEVLAKQPKPVSAEETARTTARCRHASGFPRVPGGDEGSKEAGEGCGARVDFVACTRVLMKGSHMTCTWKTHLLAQNFQQDVKEE